MYENHSRDHTLKFCKFKEYESYEIAIITRKILDTEELEVNYQVLLSIAWARQQGTLNLSEL